MELLWRVIPREGVESNLCVVEKDDPRFADEVIPREGVESHRLTKHFLNFKPGEVIPREGVERRSTFLYS